MQVKHKVKRVINRAPNSFSLITKNASVSFSFRSEGATKNSVIRLRHMAPHIMKGHPTELDPEMFVNRFIYGRVVEMEYEGHIYKTIMEL